MSQKLRVVTFNFKTQLTFLKINLTSRIKNISYFPDMFKRFVNIILNYYHYIIIGCLDSILRICYWDTRV